jgi:hypothetical protein
MPEALVIVDFQNDLMPGGALAAPDGDAVAPRLNELAASDRFEWRRCCAAGIDRITVAGLAMTTACGPRASMP